MSRFALAIPVFGVCVALAAGAVTAQENVPEYLNSGKILPTTLPFSEAVRVGDTVYLSGQIGSIPGTTDLAPGGMQAESRQVMENIKTALNAHGLDMGNLVKCTVMIADMSEWGAFNEIYKTYFEEGRYPARAAFGANGLAFDARIEVDCIAHAG